MSKLVKPIPDSIKHDWEFEVDGQPLEARHIVMSNSKFGTLSFGLRPEDTIGWMWREISSGGQGIVAYVVIQSKLYIGLIKEMRHTLGGVRLEYS